MKTCSQIDNDSLKRDRLLFVTSTKRAGYLEDDEVVLELRECRLCGSTLALRLVTKQRSPATVQVRP